VKRGEVGRGRAIPPNENPGYGLETARLTIRTLITVDRLIITQNMTYIFFTARCYA